MAEQRMKSREKKVQKMTRDGLVENNLADHSSVRVSNRTGDVKLSRKQDASKGESLKDKRVLDKGTNDKRRQNIVRSRDAPMKKDGEDAAKHKKKLAQSRGDARKEETGGTKRPQQKKRLQFTDAESGKTVDVKLQGKYEKQKAKAQKLNHKAEKAERKAPKKHSRKGRVYQEEQEPVKKRKLRFEEAGIDRSAGRPSIVRKAGLAASAEIHRQIGRVEEDNAAVEGIHKLEEGGEGTYRLERLHTRRKQRKRVKRATKLRKRADKAEVRSLYTKALSEDEKLRNSNFLKKRIRKQRIKREYAKAKRIEQSFGSATVGTIDYIKKIGGKVTNFFIENRKVYVSIGVLLALMLLIMTSLGSCSAMFMQSLVNYTGTSYVSSDDAIREAELYYTQLEADLQERINNMKTSESGYDEYRYNIAEIEHDPFVLISYLSAKYEEFTFEQVKGELDTLFALQYNLETEGVNETVTDTRTVRVGESIGQVVTSGYCNCVICCGQWSGGPTASGAYPTANHTIAVDATTPTLPMGTKVIMNGVEYTVEDTGNFSSYGVDFDVYYDNHAAASAHGHQTWEAYLADDNGTQEIEVTSTRDISVLNVTLTNNSLTTICQNRLGTFAKELFSAYNQTKGNLQMFGTPLEFNWYSRVSSYYGYRIHPTSGENQLHNGLDIAAAEGTSVKAGLEGTVTESSYNDSYGNYVIIKDKKGYELRYAHLSSRSVSAGSAIAIGDEIGLVGNTGNSTGAHLHIELLKNGERMNPIFYLETGSGNAFGGVEITSEEAQKILEEADKYVGVPYVWGGYSPSGFDCSGFVSYVLNNSGVRNWGRLTAQGLYDQCTPVSESDVQPGDLIFFTGTYDAGTPVTHVGIYVGNGNMIHCGKPVQYASIYSSYWQSHFYAFGRP